ncbi:DUF3488 and transglutaminase-like domain-containing protein [Arsenicicoccus piscis]|uniref:Transglutaminase-like domain-containing protein n=1 Tax=Arsenicicoccus piscis TaxID=673954 RepID=A0ABQ6HLS2_9MICO|nr:DUF3488 and transglutaminase-like domain-containing protein [Arsenicicoccus piscis]GMA18932.1 hypothetical protein GCM10025862_09530 [Arsenicicoccus piscis]
MRARPLDTLLAGFAVLVAAWPLSTLLVRQTWVMPTIAILLLVGVIGVLGRSQRWPAVVTVAAQVLAALLALNWLFHLGDGPYGLPTWTLPTHVSDLVTQGLRTMANYAAPAPATPGLVFLLVVMVSAFAVVVDLLAVELRSPALAGFPLLIIFMISVVNTGDALPVRYFAVLAIVWLLLVAQHNTGQLGHWGNTAVRRYEPGRGDAVGLGRFTDRARVAAVVAVLLALGAQSVLPDVPTRFLIPGLGRADSAAQGARGPISFSSSVDLDRSLRDRSDRPVLIYKTNAPQPPPLAVAVSTGYENGRWFGDRATPPGLDDLDRGQQPQGIAEGVRTVVRQFSAAGNQVSSPQLAVPGDVVQADVDARWRKDEVTGIVRVSRQAQTYRLIYREPAPTPAQLAVTRADAERSGIPLPDVYGGDLLELDPASAPLVRRTADEIVAGGVNGGPATTAYDKALAIQQYLRSNRFSYSLTLAPPQPREPGNPGAGTLDPISNFLTTRQGYCTQFATSMIMMARSQGIPARLVLGFLPGSYSPAPRATPSSPATRTPGPRSTSPGSAGPGSSRRPAVAAARLPAGRCRRRLRPPRPPRRRPPPPPGSAAHGAAGGADDQHVDVGLGARPVHPDAADPARLRARRAGPAGAHAGHGGAGAAPPTRAGTQRGRTRGGTVAHPARAARRPRPGRTRGADPAHAGRSLPQRPGARRGLPGRARDHAGDRRAGALRPHPSCRPPQRHRTERYGPERHRSEPHRPEPHGPAQGRRPGRRGALAGRSDPVVAGAATGRAAADHGPAGPLASRVEGLRRTHRPAAPSLTGRGR